MSEPINGVTVLRTTLRARNRSPHAMSLIASEVGSVSASTLEDFANGKADLSIEALQALTKVLYQHAEYDPELNALRSANKSQPISLPSAPPPFNREACPAYHAAPAGAWSTGSIKGLPVSPLARLPGWAR